MVRQKATDEPLVEVGEAQEYLQVSMSVRDWPVTNFSNLYGIYLDLILRDNQFQILNLLLVKFILFKVEE